MSRPRGGTVRHEFTPEAMLSILQYSQKLKPGVSFADSLSSTASVLHGQTVGSDLSTEFDSGSCPLPSFETLRMARVKLDCISMLWQRFLASSFSFRRFLLYDSSPQIGHDYLIVREDRIRLPLRGVLGPELRAMYDINACYEERLMPLSTLGRGNTGRAKNMGTYAIYICWNQTATANFITRGVKC